MLNRITAQNVLFEGKKRKQREESISSDEGPSQRERRSPSAEDSFGLVQKPTKRQKIDSQSIAGKLTPKVISNQRSRSGSPWKDLELPDAIIGLPTQSSQTSGSSRSSSISSQEGPSRRTFNTQPPPLEAMPSFPDIPRLLRPKARRKNSRLSELAHPESSFDPNEAHPSKLDRLPSLRRGTATPSSLLKLRSHNLRRPVPRDFEDTPQLIPPLGAHLPDYASEFNPVLQTPGLQHTLDSGSLKSTSSSPKLKPAQSPDVEMNTVEPSVPTSTSRSPKRESLSSAPPRFPDIQTFEEAGKKSPANNSPKPWQELLNLPFHTKHP